MNALVLLAVAMVAVEPNGFFYALDRPDRADRLYRIDWDGTVTPIGEEGALGFPGVVGLAWDRNEHKLYGYDSTLDVWLIINTSTGRAEELGAFSLVFRDMTFNANDGLIYAITQNEIVFVEPSTGEATLLKNISGIAGITHVLVTTGGFDGLFFVSSSGLTLLVEPTWNSIWLAGNVRGSEALIWNPLTDELYSFVEPSFYLVNQVTGNQELMLTWDFGPGPSPISNIQALTFVPSDNPPLPECVLVDSDGDDDIDLTDFADFQNCFTGPFE